MKNFSKLSIFALLLALLMMGCDAADTTDTETDTAAVEDAAESIANSVADETGGTVDQMGDVMEIAGDITEGEFSAAGKNGNATLAGRTLTFDSTNTTWTMTLARERSNNIRSASMSRVYEFQFRAADGTPQKDYEVDGVKANSLAVDLVSAIGEAHSPRLDHSLTNLAGSWTVVGIDGDVFTMNGTYSRAASDVFTRPNSIRTLDNTLDITLTDIVVERAAAGSSRLVQSVTGTMTGHYTAEITFTKGDDYAERSVDTTFEIDVENGGALVKIDGLKFTFSLATGSQQ